MTSVASTSSNVQSFLDSRQAILEEVERELDDWKGEGCFQLPKMMELMEARFGWTETQTRSNDPIIREFIRTHPAYALTRGAHGGIARRADIQGKIDLKQAKKRAKEELSKALDAKIALANQSKTVVADQAVEDDESDNGDDDMLDEN